MRLALAPINPTVGDITGNAALIAAGIGRARAAGADVVVFPELALCGYPPRDLLLQEGFVAACEEAAARLGTAETAGITAVFGVPLLGPGGGVTNSLLAYRDGVRLTRYDKRLLPTYDVFDEDRYFVGGTPHQDEAADLKRGPWHVGFAICEDLWKGEDAGFAARYRDGPDPVSDLISRGTNLILSPSASPFVLGKGQRHRDILRNHAARHGVIVASVNQLGGNDDLIFDGHALVYGPDGALLAAGQRFAGELLVVDLPDGAGGSGAACVQHPQDEGMAALCDALTLGIRDYLRKTGFRRALLGLSGGIDSALTAALAVRALGAEQVLGVALPGRYSSDHSLRDAAALAGNLGIALETISIEDAFTSLGSTLDPAFAHLGQAALGATLPDLAEENLQSRIRGTILMAISNRAGAMVLTTGNKSELSVGYCTLYGDMNGGLAVLSDVTKRLVYELAGWMNANHVACGFAGEPIPRSSISKAPSAELRPNQTDQDSLPPYDVLDEIIERHVERRQSAGRIVEETGFEAATVQRIVRLINLSEYKRRQAALGLKVTSVAFGPGRRMPVAHLWRS